MIPASFLDIIQSGHGPSTEALLERARIASHFSCHHNRLASRHGVCCRRGCGVSGEQRLAVFMATSKKGESQGGGIAHARAYPRERTRGTAALESARWSRDAAVPYLAPPVLPLLRKGRWQAPDPGRGRDRLQISFARDLLADTITLPSPVEWQPPERGRLMRRQDERGELLAVSAAEAARMLGISERHLWTITNRGQVPCVRLGKRVLYVVTQLREWLNAGAVAGG